jgi:hypothetical protein
MQRGLHGGHHHPHQHGRDAGHHGGFQQGHAPLLAGALPPPLACEPCPPSAGLCRAPPVSRCDRFWEVRSRRVTPPRWAHLWGRIPTAR